MSGQHAQLQLFHSDRALMSRTAQLNGMSGLQSFNAGLFGKVQHEAQRRPSSHVQYLVCKKLFADETLFHLATLASALNVYAVSSDFLTDDAFPHHGKNQCLRKVSANISLIRSTLILVICSNLLTIPPCTTMLELATSRKPP